MPWPVLATVTEAAALTPAGSMVTVVSVAMLPKEALLLPLVKRVLEPAQLGVVVSQVPLPTAQIRVGEEAMVAALKERSSMLSPWPPPPWPICQVSQRAWPGAHVAE